MIGALDRGQSAIRVARSLLDRVAVPRVDDAERRLHKEQRRLERLRRLAEIYGPYTELDCMFDDRGARELLDQLHPDDREDFGFDTEAIHWPTYIQEIHLPALRAMVRPPRRGLPTVGRRAARRRAAGGHAGARLLRRGGRGDRRHRRALLRLAAWRHDAVGRPRDLDGAARRARERLGVAGPQVALELQPRLLPRVPRPAGATSCASVRSAR